MDRNEIFQNKINFFCELRFLEAFSIIKPKDLSENFNDWLSAFTLFTSGNSVLYINCKKENFIEKINDNPVLRRILKAETTGYQKFKFIEIELDKLHPIKDSHAIFCLNKSKADCKILEEDYGMLFFSNEDFVIRSKILNDLNIFEISKQKNKPENWTEIIRKFIHPHNSLVIFDKYILKKNEDLRKNLISILNSLLPKKLNKLSFQLIILTETDNYLNSNKDKIYDEIIDNLDREYNINLTIFFINKRMKKFKEVHDRFIITNYFWLDSGHSFTYYNKNGKVWKNTYLKAFPITFSIDGNSINSIVYSILKNLNLIALDANGLKVGNGECRLFESSRKVN